MSDARGVGETVYTLNDYGATIKIVGLFEETTEFVWATDSPDPQAVLSRYPNHPAGFDVLLLSKTDPLGRKTEYKYDARGNMLEEKVTFSSGSGQNPLEPVKDKLGGPVSFITNTYTYDPIYNKMETHTDPETPHHHLHLRRQR